MPHPHPHPSTSSHLSTETALLQVLYTRSKHQHRSQLFLTRLQAVLRLARRLIASLPARDATSSGSGSGSGSGADTYAAARPLLPKLAAALVRAGAASSAIIELAHFVPLHTTLLACYARLLAVTLALGAALGLTQSDLLEVQRVKTPGESAVPVERDVGEVVARSSNTPDISSRSSVPVAEAEKAERRAQPGGAGKPKKRKVESAEVKTDMDEIFTKPKKKKAKEAVGDKPEKKKADDVEDEPKKRADAVRTVANDAQAEMDDSKLQNAAASPNPDPDSSAAASAPKPKKKKADPMDDIFDKPKKKKADSMDDIFDKPNKKKAGDKAGDKAKKKRSTMDAIFGF